MIGTLAHSDHCLVCEHEDSHAPTTKKARWRYPPTSLFKLPGQDLNLTDGDWASVGIRWRIRCKLLPGKKNLSKRAKEDCILVFTLPLRARKDTDLTLNLAAEKPNVYYDSGSAVASSTESASSRESTIIMCINRDATISSSWETNLLPWQTSFGRIRPR